MNFNKIDFPSNYTYSSDSENIPLEFYHKVFPKAKAIDMFLGYFNSYTFSLLSESFAEFIYNGGKVRIITNHFYSPIDQEVFFQVDEESISYESISKIISDLKKLKKTLDAGGQLFFDCLKYLMKSDRLNIQPVLFRKQLSHRKTMLFNDGLDTIMCNGSMNFTPSGLIKNGEIFQVEAPWNGEISRRRILEEQKTFERVFNKEHADYTYLKSKDLEELIDEFGNDKSIKELLRDSLQLNNNEEYSKRVKTLVTRSEERFQSIIYKIEREPRFPFDKPREYQAQAYRNWVENDYKGLFAMATGTGKTITALNCILEKYKKTGKYRVIILVPTLALASQWTKEVSINFNFQNILECTSNSDWEDTFNAYVRSINFQGDLSFITIATYATFRGVKFQRSFSRIINFDDLILIADEAHTFGAKRLLKVLPHKISKRIGLSATPERPFDKVGEKALNSFFAATPPSYTFKYDMRKAIEDGVLSRYEYYPISINLTNQELIEYNNYTKKLRRHIDGKTGRYKDNKEANLLLILRKNVIHKAANKLYAISGIVDEIGLDKLKYCFIYVPEGCVPDYSTNDYNISDEDELNRSIIDKYAKVLSEEYDLRLSRYIGSTTGRDEILKRFADGDLDILLAMKCLDEGVDIPRAEYGIFCSSTGNPRQYVQRRGRLLRTHEDKDKAIIYDLVVFPQLDDISSEYVSTTEINILKSELKRIVNFTALAENRIKILQELDSLIRPLDIDVYDLINKELESYGDIK